LSFLHVLYLAATLAGNCDVLWKACWDLDLACAHRHHRYAAGACKPAARCFLVQARTCGKKR
jgi:hypothetical protein